jgi:hypothetical protein
LFLLPDTEGINCSDPEHAIVRVGEHVSCLKVMVGFGQSVTGTSCFSKKKKNFDFSLVTDILPNISSGAGRIGPFDAEGINSVSPHSYIVYIE